MHCIRMVWNSVSITGTKGLTLPSPTNSAAMPEKKVASERKHGPLDVPVSQGYHNELQTEQVEMLGKSHLD